MRFIADFHTHSLYSRATSRDMNLEGITKWAQLKGTNVIGAGDFTHPRWFDEITRKLEPAEPGLYKLKTKFETEVNMGVPSSCTAAMRFLLSVEISTIYKKGGRVRKVHSLIFAPSFREAALISSALGKRGNLASDGRPILGLDTKDLLKIILDVSDDCLLVPAHAWTPHFAVFGSQSGFDSLEETFDELAQYIYAIETGLSSDPAMNWRLSGLDRIAFISNSDAHSPRKLGREANIFNTDLSYFAIMEALKRNDKKAFESTIEFFPEEGKYHLDGHRLCKTRFEPEETSKILGICPKCARSLTIGVLNRIAALADREKGFVPAHARPFKNIVPLPEVIGEVEQVGPASKKVDGIYFRLLAAIGNEFSILLDTPLSEIERHSSVLLAKAVGAVREGAVSISAGYDGEYGVIRIFGDKEKENFNSDANKQSALF